MGLLHSGWDCEGDAATLILHEDWLLNLRELQSWPVAPLSCWWINDALYCTGDCTAVLNE